MNHEAVSAYGLWSLVGINSLVFLIFAYSFTKPRSSRDWRSFGAFSAFIVAMFTEMYGVPVTIYLLSGWLQRRYPGLDPLSHDAGHLWWTLTGQHGNPHSGVLHILSYLLIVGGFILLSAAWPDGASSAGLCAGTCFLATALGRRSSLRAPKRAPPQVEAPTGADRPALSGARRALEEPRPGACLPAQFSDCSLVTRFAVMHARFFCSLAVLGDGHRLNRGDHLRRNALMLVFPSARQIGPSVFAAAGNRGSHGRGGGALHLLARLPSGPWR